MLSKLHSLWYLLQPPNKVNTVKAIFISSTRLTFYRKQTGQRRPSIVTSFTPVDQPTVDEKH